MDPAASVGDIGSLVAQLGLTGTEVPHIVAAATDSWRRLQAIRRSLADVSVDVGVAVCAVGSLGRFEASAASDVDLAVIYRASITADAAAAVRTAVVTRLRADGHLVFDKTFRAPVGLSALLGDIGGEGDSNLHLTYRALLLTEGVWLAAPDAAAAMHAALFAAYAAKSVTRGRFLGSLQNDLHRYYRTICVDYRFKVEDGGKCWAPRYFKLRHARKVWHLANLLLFCSAATVADEQRDTYLVSQLPRPPLQRVVTLLSGLGAPGLAAPLFRAYDRYLGVLAEPRQRQALDDIEHHQREADPLYRELVASADQLDLAAQAIVEHLWISHRGLLVRYGLL